MINLNYEEEIQRFKQSRNIEEVEDAILKTDLTDMHDIMTKLIENLINTKKDSER